MAIFRQIHYNLEAGDFRRVLAKIWSKTSVWNRSGIHKPRENTQFDTGMFLAADSSDSSIAVVSSAASLASAAKTFRVRYRNYENKTNLEFTLRLDSSNEV